MPFLTQSTLLKIKTPQYTLSHLPALLCLLVPTIISPTVLSSELPLGVSPQGPGFLCA
jgi:hypothetical protein